MAIVGGAAIIGAGMGTQAYFGNKSRGAAKRAAQAAAEEMRLSKKKAIGYQQPFYNSGMLGLNNLTGLLTGFQYDTQGNKTSLNEQERANLFEKSPGYQFRLQQAQNALQASQAAKGGLLSGGAMKEMNAYTQGIASDEYSNYINQLAGLAGIGQNAATAMGNYQIGAGSQIANYTQQAGMTGSKYYQDLGNNIGGGLKSIGGMMLGSGLEGLNSQAMSANQGGISNWNYSTNSPNFNTQLGKY